MLSEKEIKIIQDYEENLQNSKTYPATKNKLKKVINNYKDNNISESLCEELKKIYNKCDTTITNTDFNNFSKYLNIFNNILDNKETISSGRFQNYEINFMIKEPSFMYWNLKENNIQKAIFIVNLNKKDVITYRDKNASIYISVLSAAIFLSKSNEYGTHDKAKVIIDSKKEKAIRKIFKKIQKCHEKISDIIYSHKMSIDTANVILETINNNNVAEIERIIELKKEKLNELGRNLKMFNEIAKDVTKITNEEADEILLVTDINAKEYLKNNKLNYFISKTKNKLFKRKK